MCHLVAAILAFMVTGCVTSPINDSTNCSDDVLMQGYGSNASSTITFYAWNYDSEPPAWDVVGSTTTAASSSSYGNCTGYYYSGYADLEDSAYWDWIGGGWERQVKAKYGSLHHYTFDSGGLDCMVEKLDDDWSCYDAGQYCMSEDSPVITLYCASK